MNRRLLVVWSAIFLCMAVMPVYVSAQSTAVVVYSVDWRTRFSQPLGWDEFVHMHEVSSDSLRCQSALLELKKYLSQRDEIAPTLSGNIDQRVVIIGNGDTIEVGPHMVKYNGKYIKTDLTVLGIVSFMLPIEFSNVLHGIVRGVYCDEK